MSHLVCYTIRIKMIMKEQTNKASNLILGAIYINAITSQPCRLVNIVSCQGVWLEAYDGQGYGDLVSFDDVLYASVDEVQDYLEDLRVYTASEKAPTYKPDIANWSKQFLPIQLPNPREYYDNKRSCVMRMALLLSDGTMITTATISAAETNL